MQRLRTSRCRQASRYLEGCPIAVSRLWWTPELVSRGVAKRCQACLTEPRTPSWPPFLDGEAVHTKKQRRLAIARETLECRPKLRRFALSPNQSLIASAPSTGEPSTSMIRWPGMPGNAAGRGEGRATCRRRAQRWSATVAPAWTHGREHTTVAVPDRLNEPGANSLAHELPRSEVVTQDVGQPVLPQVEEIGTT